MSLATAPETSVDLANRLRPVLLHINRHLRREAHAQGISPGQISMLSAICDRPGIGVAELAAREGMSSPSVSVHLDRLEAAGFVTRLREEDGDRRRVGLTVTPKGSRVLRTVRSRRTLFPDIYVYSPNPHANYDVAPDGEHFVFARANPSTRVMVIQNLAAMVAKRRAGGQGS